jgi:hypothetical protein
MDFRYKEKSESIRFDGWPAALGEFGQELAEAFGYWLGPLALFGVWRMRNLIKRPLDRFLQMLFVLFAGVALAFAVWVGYLSDRHLLPLLVVALGSVGFGTLELGRAMRAALTRRRVFAAPSLVSLAVLAVAGLCLVRTLKPLHTARAPHAAAAGWLAQEAEVPGAVLDTLGWTSLYSGRKTYGYGDAAEALADPRLAYVVVEQRELEYDSQRARTLEYLLQNAAEPAAGFAPNEADSGRSPTVLVFRWQPDRFARLATQSMVAAQGRVGERQR